MSINSNTYRQGSSFASVDDFFQGVDEPKLQRLQLVHDYIKGLHQLGWSERFFLLKGHCGQWGGDLFNCLHLLHPEYDRESFHKAFSYGVAEACLRRHQNRFLILCAGLKSWEALSGKHLHDPESPEQMTDRILERMSTHPIYAPVDLEFMLLPASYEHRQIRLEEKNLNYKPLIDKLTKDTPLTDASLGRSKGSRFKWAVQHFPQAVIKSYFERHPDSPLLAQRLELEIGL